MCLFSVKIIETFLIVKIELLSHFETHILIIVSSYYNFVLSVIIRKKEVLNGDKVELHVHFFFITSVSKNVSNRGIFFIV